MVLVCLLHTTPLQKSLDVVAGSWDTFMCFGEVSVRFWGVFGGYVFEASMAFWMLLYSFTSFFGGQNQSTTN